MFSHILIARNPSSTNTESGKQYIKAIKKACPNCTIEIAHIDEVLPNLKDRLTGKTLLCLAGGDGSTNSAVQAILGSSSLNELQRHVPILPLWGGNANDIAHILNGKPSIEKCTEIIAEGQSLPIYPLRCSITTKGKPEQVRYAIGYASFGATAEVARHLNKKGLRKNPLPRILGGKTVKELVISLKALHDAPTFTVEYKGKRKVVYDWMVGKGPRMAKLLKMPVSLTDHTFYQSIMERKWLPGVIIRAVELTWGNLGQENNDKKPIKFTTENPIWAQFDGEPLHIPAGSTVTVSLNEHPFYALSTACDSDKLKA